MPFLPVRFFGGSVWADTRLVTLSVQAGTGATTVADSTTTSIILPRPPVASAQLVRLDMQVLVAAVSAGGAVTAQFFRRNNQGTPADVTLTATKSLKSDIVTVADKSYSIALTATSIQNLLFLTGDVCRIDLVAASSVTTQPTVSFVGLWAIEKVTAT